jgi:hypothetical protein
MLISWFPNLLCFRFIYIQLSVSVRYILAYVRDDGWNADGREGGREGNLRPFQDTTGYRPAPHAGDGLVGANPRRWVPLPETDDRGFFYVQKHVTPQIGSTGRTYLVSEAELANRYTDVPKYNLTAEALDVVRRTVRGCTS